jgi:hypothetical protein
MEDFSIQFLVAMWFIVWIVSSVIGGIIRGYRYVGLMERLANLESQISSDLDGIKNKL